VYFTSGGSGGDGGRAQARAGNTSSKRASRSACISSPAPVLSRQHARRVSRRRQTFSRRNAIRAAADSRGAPSPPCYPYRPDQQPGESATPTAARLAQQVGEGNRFAWAATRVIASLAGNHSRRLPWEAAPPVPGYFKRACAKILRPPRHPADPRRGDVPAWAACGALWALRG